MCMHVFVVSCVCIYVFMYIDQIIEILAFRDKVLRTGMNPSTTVSEDICKELYPKCYSSSGTTSNNNQKKKTKKKEANEVKSTATVKDTNADAEF